MDQRWNHPAALALAVPAVLALTAARITQHFSPPSSPCPCLSPPPGHQRLGLLYPRQGMVLALPLRASQVDPRRSSYGGNHSPGPDCGLVVGCGPGCGGLGRCGLAGDCGSCSGCGPAGNRGVGPQGPAVRDSWAHFSDAISHWPATLIYISLQGPFLTYTRPKGKRTGILPNPNSTPYSYNTREACTSFCGQISHRLPCFFPWSCALPFSEELRSSSHKTVCQDALHIPFPWGGFFLLEFPGVVPKWNSSTRLPVTQGFRRSACTMYMVPGCNSTS